MVPNLMPMAAAVYSYPCPCCGYLSQSEPPGSYNSCEICRWTDDPSQLRFARTRGGANRESLVQAQENYRSYGASEHRKLPNVRVSGSEDLREPAWRVWNPKTDDTERSETSAGYGKCYPSDTTTLYYWRETYWRKRSSRL